jgi:hypothetical protein
MKMLYVKSFLMHRLGASRVSRRGGCHQPGCCYDKYIED